MKFVIQNYSSNTTTEPLYFDMCLKQIQGVETFVWNSNEISVYDCFDKLKPDILITDFRVVTNDMIKYLSGSSKIQVLMNITGASQENMEIVTHILITNNIECPFLFNNAPTELTKCLPKSIKIESILSGYDVFAAHAKRNLPDFNIGAGLVTFNNKDLLNKESKAYETCHKMSIGDPNNGVEADMFLSIYELASLYHKYNTVVLVDSLTNVFSQVLYDALALAKDVKIVTPEEEKSQIGMIFESVFGRDSKIEDAKKIIKKKHSCFNRTKRLLEKLKCTNYVDSISKIIEKAS